VQSAVVVLVAHSVQRDQVESVAPSVEARAWLVDSSPAAVRSEADVITGVLAPRSSVASAKWWVC